MVKKKSKCGCFAFLSFFTSKKKKTQVDSQQNNHDSHAINSNLHSSMSHLNSSSSNKNFKKIDVLTKMTTDDVKLVDFITETAQKMEFPYSCTICLRNFNKLLQTSCCKNYICLYCIEDYNKRFQTTPALKIKCHYCNEEALQFIDIDPAEKIKRYTDSLSSFYSNLYPKALKPLKFGNSTFKAEEILNSPGLPLEDPFNPEIPANFFYNTAEKPSENVNSANKVLFYSDGFKRASNMPLVLNENLYIYNENQANYQSLSKFSKSKKSFSEAKKNFDDPNEYQLEVHYLKGNDVNRFDPRNISESAEFRQDHDDSLNDRDGEQQKIEDLIENEEENKDEENEENYDSHRKNLKNKKFNDKWLSPLSNDSKKINGNDQDNKENTPEVKNFSSHDDNGVSGRWSGMKVDLGGTV